MRYGAYCGGTLGKDLNLLLDENKNIPQADQVNFEKVLRYQKVLPPNQDKSLGQILQKTLPTFQQQLWANLNTTNRIKSHVGLL